MRAAGFDHVATPEPSGSTVTLLSITVSGPIPLIRKPCYTCKSPSRGTNVCQRHQNRTPNTHSTSGYSAGQTGRPGMSGRETSNVLRGELRVLRGALCGGILVCARYETTSCTDGGLVWRSRIPRAKGSAHEQRQSFTVSRASRQLPHARLSGRVLSNTIARVLAGACSLFFLGSGLFALLAPEAFYNLAALYPPYNRHFIHDIGAFMLGLGAGLALALVLTDALLVGLAAATVAGVAHFVSHVMDRELGGLPTDPITFGVFALVLVGLTWWRLRRVSLDPAS